MCVCMRGDVYSSTVFLELSFLLIFGNCLAGLFILFLGSCYDGSFLRFQESQGDEQFCWQFRGCDTAGAGWMTDGGRLHLIIILPFFIIVHSGHFLGEIFTYLFLLWVFIHFALFIFIFRQSY